MIQNQTVVEKDKDSSSDTKIKYYFQGQLTRSQNWFKLYTYWMEVIFDK